MNDDLSKHNRRLRIFSSLALRTKEGDGHGRLCEVAVELTGARGAAITLISDGTLMTPVCTTDTISDLIDELQFDLGEGPSIDSFRTELPVLEPDLVQPSVSRWTAFSPAAIDAGVRSIFGFPLRVSDSCIGALNLYSDVAWSLSPEQHDYAVDVAEIAARALLAEHNDAATGLNLYVETVSKPRWLIHQASGMVSVQLAVTASEALARIRAYAFAHERHVADVSDDIVNRRLRFGPEMNE